MKVTGMKVPIFTNDFEKSVHEYETLLGAKAQNRFEISSPPLSVARIQDLLIVGGSDEVLQSLPAIKATLTVDSIDEYFVFLKETGATILQPPTSTPTGRNMIAKNRDGHIFEYVELKG